MCPGLAGVGGLVNPVADGQIRSLQTLSAGDVNDIGIRRRNRDRADGLSRLIIENRIPGSAIVVRLPHSTIHRAHVENVRFTRYAGNSARPAATKGPDHPPPHLLKQSWRILMRVRNLE